MAKATPAHIIYTPDGGDEQVINFHAVIGEDHQASAQVTKYPVQTGYQISNHSIRQNRLVTLEGIFSNTILNNGGFVYEAGVNGTQFNDEREQIPNDDQYGADTNKAVFQVLEALVNSGQEVKVVTNLGVYEPVVFTRFKTKQEAGMVDSMRFTLIGEEIIKVNEDGSTAPAELTFKVIEGAEREAVVSELDELGYTVGSCDEISTTSYRVGDDFVITGVDSAGQPVETTYVYAGLDPATGEPIYEVHVSESAVAVESGNATEAKNDPCAEESFEDSLLGGISQVAHCLVGEVTDILVDELEDVIDTAMGDLTQSLYGAFYDMTQGSELGSSLLKAGIGCVVRTATGGGDPDIPYQPGESLPTTDDIMTGASNGLGLTEPEPEIVTLTQIQCACSGDTPQDIATDLIPLPF